MGSLLWTPSAWFLAQVNHILASSVIVLICARQGWPMLWVLTAIIVLTAAKEFWADLTWLEHEGLAGAIADWACYLIGAMGTWLALDHLWWGVGVVAGSILLLTVWDILVQHFPLTFGP